MGWFVMAMVVLMALGALLWFKPSSSKNIGETQDEILRCRQAAEKGDAKAQLSLGISYDTGSGVEQNEVEAVKWFRLAAEQEFAPAQERLEEMCVADQSAGQDDTETVCGRDEQ